MKKQEYQFEWCKECDLLRGCYYQHGDYSGHPYFITEECAKEPYKDYSKSLFLKK